MSFAKKINNVEVKPMKITVKSEDDGPFLGQEMMSSIYSRILLVSPPESGKTTALNTILEQSAGKHTTVIMFSNTINADAKLLQIRDNLEKKGIAFVGFDSIKKNGTNRLGLLFDKLQKDSLRQQERVRESKEMKRAHKQVPEKDIGGALQYMTFLNGGFIAERKKAEEEKAAEKTKEAILPEIPEPKKEKKKGPRAPRYILVLDDISNELENNQYLDLFLRENRHFKMLLIVSTQALGDLDAQDRKMFNIQILFGGLPDPDLENIYLKSAIRSVSWKLFHALYVLATTDPTKKKPFFYIDKNTNDFRQNFNVKYDVETLKKLLKMKK